MSKDGGGLALRLGTALAVLPVVLALVWIPALDAVWSLFVSLVATVGLYEYYHLARARQLRPHIAMVGLGAAVVLSAGLGNPSLTQTVLFGACAVAGVVHLRQPSGSLTGMATSVFGIVYVTWFSAHVLLLHQLPGSGRGLVMLLLAAVILTDVGAYFAGKALGRHKLAPVISPNKTWEGAFGGFVLTVAGMVALYFACDAWELDALPAWTLNRFVITGGVLSLSAQAGDLIESALKRDAQVKDSGRAFPGHGGVLDRCDGFLLAAPVLYYMENCA